MAEPSSHLPVLVLELIKDIVAVSLLDSSRELPGNLLSSFPADQTWSLLTGVSQNIPPSLKVWEQAGRTGLDHSPRPFLPDSVMNRRKWPWSQRLTLFFAAWHHLFTLVEGCRFEGLVQL